MKNDTEKFILGVALGALAGAALGILFAPKSGKETRQVLGKKMKRCVEDCTDLLERGKRIAKAKVRETADNISAKMD